MQSFSSKGVSEVIDVSVDFTALLPAGVTLASATVTAAVYLYSPVQDPNPLAILSGAAQVNASSFNTPNGTMAANMGIIQRLAAVGVINCQYLLTFSGTTSDGETIVEQVTITIIQYVPA